jgi:hypothetical protein
MGMAKGLAQMGASFIPGVGPIASAAIGAIGGSGKQGSQKQNQNQQTKQTESFNSTNNIDMFDEAIEDESFSQARTSLIPMLQQQMRKAQQPVYGDAQKASYLGNLNELADNAMASLKGSLASSGRLDSGAFETGASDIAREKIGQASSFFSDLPFRERQAQAEQLNPLMNLAAGWFGRAPISTKRTGTNNQTGNSVREGNMTSTGESSMEGPGFWKGFANNLGGAMNQTGQGNLPGMFGGSPSYTPPSAWSAPGGFLTNVRPRGMGYE